MPKPNATAAALDSSIAAEHSRGRKLVEAMTNSVRTRWAKKGYPGLRNSVYYADEIEKFLNEDTTTHV